MKNLLKFAKFGLVLVAFVSFSAKGTNEPIYIYEGITVQDMAEVMQKEMMHERAGLNKFGEFLYSAKDSFFMSIGDSLANMLRFISASAKVLGIGKETNANFLLKLDDARLSGHFEKALADSRLGVESDVLSNKIAIVIFCPIGSVLFGDGILHRIESATKFVRDFETSIHNGLYK